MQIFKTDFCLRSILHANDGPRARADDRSLRSFALLIFLPLFATKSTANTVRHAQDDCHRLVQRAELAFCEISGKTKSSGFNGESRESPRSNAKREPLRNDDTEVSRDSDASNVHTQPRSSTKRPSSSSESSRKQGSGVVEYSRILCSL